MICINILIVTRLTGGDKEIQLQCAKAWTAWELCMFSLISDPAVVASQLADEKRLLTKALIEW